MTTIAFRVISTNPFVVEYISGEKTKRVTYDVCLTNREIMEEARYIVFDE